MSETEQEQPEQDTDTPDEAVGGDDTPTDEPDEAEPAPDTDEPQEPADEPAQASEVELERVSKAMDRAAKSYVDKVVQNLGQDLSGWKSCPCCSGGWPGLVLPRMPEPEVLAQIKDFIGEPATPPYLSDRHSTPCNACDGWGNVTTGSHVANRGVAVCLECDGKGYIAHHERRESGSLIGAGVAGMPPVYNQQAPPADDPPEVQKLRDLGFIVVEPVVPVNANG